ncbi:MAG TPA: flagellar biosynthetic protein FliO [Alphaproteobacteria bacterium]|nr:flagellar biosynthetic protein FliO [Alphaproteobacteria bacterium]HRK97830.1 flagellar biosynthetic protein FliO [Alphaproteobacteria bacterium]
MDTIELVRFFVAFLFVMALMGGLWLALRKLGLNGHIPVTQISKRRLKIVEVMALDPRRKAIILRRDDKEHLVILGSSGETVVESSFPAKAENPDHHV